MKAAALSALATLALAAGCGPTERDRCFDAAEAASQRRVERECPGLFDTCPAAADILTELRVAQEACP